MKITRILIYVFTKTLPLTTSHKKTFLQLFVYFFTFTAEIQLYCKCQLL